MIGAGWAGEWKGPERGGKGRGLRAAACEQRPRAGPGRAGSSPGERRRLQAGKGIPPLHWPQKARTWRRFGMGGVEEKPPRRGQWPAGLERRLLRLGAFEGAAVSPGLRLGARTEHATSSARLWGSPPGDTHTKETGSLP